jgi:8-oxo-dGTP pyrophosphatase MutT (NUDIX family)
MIPTLRIHNLNPADGKLWAMSVPSQERYVAQAAAIPVRKDPKTGRPQVLLIRRRDGRKWGIPKGLVDPGYTHAQTAAKESVEEAGVEGVVSGAPVGDFTYDKFGGTCLVKVYVLRVTRVLDHWDEEAVRERRWFDAREAGGVASRPAVRELIAKATAAAPPDKTAGAVR